MTETQIARTKAVTLEKLVGMSAAEIRAVGTDRGYRILSNSKKAVIEDFLTFQRADSLIEADDPFEGIGED